MTSSAEEPALRKESCLFVAVAMLCVAPIAGFSRHPEVDLRPAETIPEMAVPADVQLKLLLKVLTADRNSATPSGAPISIGIVFQGNVSPSRAAKDALVAAIAGSGPPGHGRPPVRPVLLEVGDAEGLSRLSSVGALRVLYVAPLRGLLVDRISAMSRERKILTVTGVPSYVDAGLAVGFEARRGSPVVIVNHGASIAEGADFSSKLLNLARIVGARRKVDR